MLLSKFYTTRHIPLIHLNITASLIVAASFVCTFVVVAVAVPAGSKLVNSNAVRRNGDSAMTTTTRRFELKENSRVRIKNLRGRVQVSMNESAANVEAAKTGVTNHEITNHEAMLEVLTDDGDENLSDIDSVIATRNGDELSIDTANLSSDALTSSGAPASLNAEKSNRVKSRVDLILHLPARIELQIETADGAVEVTGDFANVSIKTTTGTISADTPVADLRYKLQWTASRPRLYSAIDLSEPKEQSAGRFEIAGRLGANAKKKKAAPKNIFPFDKVQADKTQAETLQPEASQSEAMQSENQSSATDSDETTSQSDETANQTAARENNKQLNKENKRQAKRDAQQRIVRLDVTTERGIVIFGVDPANVPVDLRERKLTEAARAILRTGDSELIERIRRIAPKLVSPIDGTLTLSKPGTPTLLARRASNAAQSDKAQNAQNEHQAQIIVSVTNSNGQALRNLSARDFSVIENGTERPITAIKEGEAPFNLVLLLDVSGSVEERLEFIRRAAQAFVASAAANDRLAIVSFRDDVQNISGFTSDKNLLRQRINDIEAGGATALYDATAYTLLETIRPLAQNFDERTALVILSDGDDNRSFLSFADVNRLAREAAASIYPIYIPSGLLAASKIVNSEVLNSEANSGTNSSSKTGNNVRIANTAGVAAAVSLDPTRNRLLTLTTRANDEGQTLARTSGGTFHTVTRFSELQTAYSDVIAQLRNSYTITYTTPLAEARVRVRVKNDKATNVRISRAN